MIESKSLVLRLVIAICCFIYSTLLMQTSHKKSASYHGGIGEFAFCLWAVLDLIQSMGQDIEFLITDQTLIYICAQVSVCSLICYTYFLFTREKITERKPVYLIYIIPLVSLILTVIFKLFTSGHFFIKVPETLSPATLPAYNFPKTIFYYIHSFFCYVSIALCILYSLYAELSLKTTNKMIIVVYGFSALLFLIMNIYKFFIENFQGDQYLFFSDFSASFSYLILSTASFLVIYFQRKERSMRILNESLFSSSNYAIFVFSNKDEFLEANETAQNFLEFHGIPAEKNTDINGMFSENYFARLGFFEDVQQKDEFYLFSLKNRSLYYGQKVNLYEGNMKVGYYLMLVQVSIYSELLNRIEKESDTDSLTGFKKQNTFEKVFTEEINSHIEPLVVVCAKINNLDHLNTSIGLKKTNLYINSFANILNNVIKQMNIQQEVQKNIFRISGSLFVFIVSMKQQERIQELFKSIKRECSHFSKNRVEELSCSLGYSIANNRESSASKVLQKSYENMFFDRK